MGTGGVDMGNHRDGAGRRYAFGDSELAAERLGRLAGVFEPTTRAFVAAAPMPRTPRLVVDIGCGPGHTTRLLGEITAARAVVGIDQSPAFVAAARAHTPRAQMGRRVTYAVHDALSVPFPCGLGDVVFARLVLAHLPSVADVVASWLTQVRAGGVLLLEEVERIDTDHPVLVRYLALIGERVRRQGSDMVAGPALAALAPTRTEVRHQLASLRPPLGHAVTLFALNLAVLEGDPVMDDLLPERERSVLASQLGDLAGDRRSGAIEWTMHQTSLRPLST